VVFRYGGVIMNIDFRRTCSEGLINYLYIRQPEGHYRAAAYNEFFHHYLSLANRLVGRLSCYVLTRYSPFLREAIPDMQLTDWHYNVISDDFQGLGADLGFSLSHRLKNGNSVKEQSAFFPLKDLLTLRSFPEDTFGDKSSNVTIFALKPGAEKEIMSFLSTTCAPCLPELLLENEIFIHITCSKSSGYYDTMLIKSVQSLETILTVNDH
jgi:hypothetical protein